MEYQSVVGSTGERCQSNGRPPGWTRVSWSSKLRMLLVMCEPQEYCTHPQPTIEIPIIPINKPAVTGE